ncbi:hypothetical protein FBY41_0972 [Humibacillus xanthopallidus]|uniref:Uncharacterized protein n=1 Tax=Humibacillus xanthopallidus TaxID=412689 RepID=A0A543I205_9MICO|nr:DUF6544 family protein [Humibacillus xanthopallidus]TQM64602.1 hypothetical protein FBY41_0972 [Humibacillus xanthopallidus]
MLLRHVIRWFVIVVVALHGLLHLLGAVKGFGWAAVPALSTAIGPWLALVWLVVAVLMLAVAVLLARGSCPWWLPLVAAVGSQVLVLSAWQDASAGTAVNLLLLVVAAHAWARTGPQSLRADYARHVEAALTQTRPAGFVTGDHLDDLPEPVARLLHHVGAVDRPAVVGFRATIHGRIRGGPAKPWMPFTGEQVNVYGSEPCRLFFMDATMFGLPVDVLHLFDRQGATMRVRLASVVPIVSAAGDEMDRAETVTVLNDLCLLVPAALVGAPIVWTSPPGENDTATAEFTLGRRTVTAALSIDADGRLTDFVSDDRLRARPTGARSPGSAGRLRCAPRASGRATGYAVRARRAGTRPSPREPSPTSSSSSTTGPPSRVRRGRQREPSLQRARVGRPP